MMVCSLKPQQAREMVNVQVFMAAWPPLAATAREAAPRLW